jgi:hypothetical protein
LVVQDVYLEAGRISGSTVSRLRRGPCVMSDSLRPEPEAKRDDDEESETRLPEEDDETLDDKDAPDPVETKDGPMIH